MEGSGLVQSLDWSSLIIWCTINIFVWGILLLLHKINSYSTEYEHVAPLDNDIGYTSGDDVYFSVCDFYGEDDDVPGNLVPSCGLDYKHSVGTINDDGYNSMLDCAMRVFEPSDKIQPYENDLIEQKAEFNEELGVWEVKEYSLTGQRKTSQQQLKEVFDDRNEKIEKMVQNHVKEFQLVMMNEQDEYEEISMVQIQEQRSETKQRYRFKLEDAEKRFSGELTRKLENQKREIEGEQEIKNDLNACYELTPKQQSKANEIEEKHKKKIKKVEKNCIIKMKKKQKKKKPNVEEQLLHLVEDKEYELLKNDRKFNKKLYELEEKWKKKKKLKLITAEQ